MRTIVPPPEWAVTCECKAVLAYTDKDVFWDRPLLQHYVVCPHCEKHIEIPDEPQHRKPVEEQA